MSDPETDAYLTESSEVDRAHLALAVALSNVDDTAVAAAGTLAELALRSPDRLAALQAQHILVGFVTDRIEKGEPLS